ncbi:glycosyltransferase [Arthrobacter castelli]|uniref:glycosyltransferase n=1 Tax=Arthrobacter castelli TaxID=271431 RepID=UPI001FE0CB74|nr:glycosyltransferase [Arthrobacter castelli]
MTRAKRYESYAFWRSRPISPDSVVYESFSGNGMLDNPEAIFQTLLNDPQMSHLRHIWVLSDLDHYRSAVERYSHYDNVEFVEYKTDRYYKALATSQYLINNATFPWQFSKRDGQTYINTWHGTPLKRMGYDVEGGGPDTRNVIRNFVAADYLLSANEFMSEQMYLEGYKLRNIFEGKIVEEGYPRVDRQFATANDPSAFRQQMRSAGIELDDRKIILYAPTWKGESFYRPVNDAIALKRVVEQLEQNIDTSEYRILLKTHQVVYREMAEMPELAGYLVPNDVPANLVLGATDVLVTDYSSIFFDYLASGHPVLFHLPDLDQYSSGRGLYLSTDELPGPVSTDVTELSANIKSLEQRTDGQVFADPDLSARYESARQRFCRHEDGHAAQRIVDIIFKGVEGMNVRHGFSDGREAILIYLGGMAPNGITASALNLLNNIDHSRFDVSAFYSYSRMDSKKRSAATINPNVRLFPREGGLNGSKVEHWMMRSHIGKGPVKVVPDHAPDARIWKDEWRRCFGDSEFDYIVDFSGYGPFWDYILLNGRAKTHSIWLHNDVWNDSQRTVDGKQPLRRGLGAVFKTYHRFDRLVSVSEALQEVNQPNLTEYASADRFVSAVNTVNADQIRRNAFGDADSNAPADTPALESTPKNLSEAVAYLKQGYPLASVASEVQRQRIVDTYMPHRDNVTTFVTVGRLSPEKNHARLLRAFADIHHENPATRLVIVGSGPLTGELRDIAAHHGLSRSVTFTGQQPNAAVLMSAADCMVMSSDYEGQPMVILEALILGIPVLTTAFESAASALPEGTGLVVDRDDTALADGMRRAIRGEIPTAEFDADAYNRKAMQQFYRAIGAEDDQPKLPRSNMK